MDVGANSAGATKKVCTQAVIVHDRFHVSLHLNDAVDKVWQQEHRRLLDHDWRHELTCTMFLWLQRAAPED